MARRIAGLPARSPRSLKPRISRQYASLEQAGLFVKNFLQHPLMLGSVIPSSRYLINRVLDKVDWSEVRTAVEYGPGVGTFTSPMLERMGPDAKLLAIEINRSFAEILRREASDARLHVVHGSAADVVQWMRWKRFPPADFILSGIPYTVLPRDSRRSILAGSQNVLASDGLFVAYQYTRAVLSDLRQVFGSIEEDFVPLNILPARVFVCRKKLVCRSRNELHESSCGEIRDQEPLP